MRIFLFVRILQLEWMNKIICENVYLNRITYMIHTQDSLYCELQMMMRSFIWMSSIKYLEPEHNLDLLSAREFRSTR